MSVRVKNLKKPYGCKKDYICNPATRSSENGKYLMIKCDEILDVEVASYNETTNIIPSKTVLTKSTSTNFSSLLAFLLLIAATIYCYMIKYESIQIHLLPYYVTDKKLKQVLY